MYTTTDNHQPPPEIGVLHLTIGFARGGRRDAILTLASASRPLGILPHLATLRGNPTDITPFEEYFEGTHLLDIRGLPTWRQLRDLGDLCIAHNIRIVHAHDASSQLVASLLRLVAPKPHSIMTFHRSLGFESAGWKNRLRNAVTLPLVDRVLTASTERRYHFLAENIVSGKKVEVIPLGIDLDRFRPDPESRALLRAEFGIGEEDFLVVSAGHYGPEKGLDIAVEAVRLAAREVGATGPRLCHLHLGTGDPARVEWMAAHVGEAGGVTTLVGQRPDPERFFAAADLLLHAPRLEAFGLVLVQAMASGLPVVATTVGGIPEIVARGTGLLAQSEDAGGLCESIVRLVRHPEERHRMAEAALARARAEYGSATFAARHRALYASILALSR